MVFWLAILSGAFFVWLAIKRGFFESWALLFNILISIYISIFSTSLIIRAIPAAGDTVYGYALTLLTTAIGTFLILHTVCYVLITAQYNVTFPKIFDILFAGLLGFLAGFLVLSFIAFIILVTPISQNHFVSKIGFSRQSQQVNVNLSYLSWWCDLVHKITASEDSQYTSGKAIHSLLEKAEKKIQRQATDGNEPNKPAEHNTVDRENRLNRPSTDKNLDLEEGLYP